MDRSSMLVWALAIALLAFGVSYISSGLSEECGVNYIITASGFSKIKPLINLIAFTPQTGFTAVFYAPVGYTINGVTFTGSLFSNVPCSARITRVEGTNWGIDAGSCVISKCPNGPSFFDVTIYYVGSDDRDGIDSGLIRLPLSDGTDVVVAGLLLILAALMVGIAEALLSRGKQAIISVQILLVAVFIASEGFIARLNHGTDLITPYWIMPIILSVLSGPVIIWRLIEARKSKNGRVRDRRPNQVAKAKN